MTEKHWGYYDVMTIRAYYNLVIVIVHEVDAKSKCFPNVTQKIDVPLVITATSLDEPRHLTSIHTSFIPKSQPYAKE